MVLLCCQNPYLYLGRNTGVDKWEQIEQNVDLYYRKKTMRKLVQWVNLSRI